MPAVEVQSNLERQRSHWHASAAPHIRWHRPLLMQASGDLARCSALRPTHSLGGKLMRETFTALSLRFTARVQTPIVLGRFKGSALRGAWQSHLRMLYCPRQGAMDLVHDASTCPVCYLLYHETSPGDSRRPYAFEPPLGRQTVFRSGEPFSFGMTLFGHTAQFLPYIILSVQAIGTRHGLGRPVHPGTGRGTFRLVRVDEINPITGHTQAVFESGNAILTRPRLAVSQSQINESAQSMYPKIASAGNLVTLQFLTPTRVVRESQLVRSPDFVSVLARLVERVSSLRTQFADGAPVDKEEKRSLLALGRRVKLVRDETRWWDAKGYSRRLGREQPLGGFVGRVTYWASDWTPFLPWLLWGTSTHVGKNAVKGSGWFRLLLADTTYPPSLRRVQ